MSLLHSLNSTFTAVHGGAFLGVFLVSVLVQRVLIWGLRSGRVFQAIYALSPGTHQAKSSTPSFGGVGILIGVWIGWGWLGWCFDFHSFESGWLLAVFTVFCFIGFWDDLASKLKRHNQGLRAQTKFWVQVAAAVGLLGVFHVGGHALSVWEWGVYGVGMVGFSNATNLTDGLDGLLGGLVLTSCVGFGAAAFQAGWMTGVVISGVLAAVTAGFLFWNWHPAAIFMGDTGSLAFGAVFVGMSLILGSFWLMIPFGAVYLMETVSVMIQVAWFKRTGRRVFLMTPIHHHFELMGVPETWVVFLFWAMSWGILVGYFWLGGGVN